MCKVVFDDLRGGNQWKKHIVIEKQVPLRLPDLKLVITATEYGYKRDDGVYVIPIGCLKD